MALLMVTAAVLLQVGCAVILKTLADRTDVTLALLGAGIGAVALLNGLRFVMWGVVHRRYPLSISYPLSGVFFPLMLGVAYLYGDPIHITQVAGTLLISSGVVWLTVKTQA